MQRLNIGGRDLARAMRYAAQQQTTTMKTSKILTLSLAAGVAGVAVAEITGARALFVSGETFFSTIAFIGIGAIALADQFRHRRVGEVRAVDGVSLTVNTVAGAEFGVNIVPHTLAHTSLDALRAGSRVNLEVDLLARYLERLLGRADVGIDLNLLAENGFLKQ